LVILNPELQLSATAAPRKSEANRSSPKYVSTLVDLRFKLQIAFACL